MIDRLATGLRSRACLGVILAADVVYKSLAVFFPDIHGHGFDSDEAIVGLMALRTLEHGEPALFFYGQSFGGGPEYLITTILFSILPASITTLRLAALPLRLGSDVLFYLLLRRAFADRLPRHIGLLLFITMSAFFHGYLARFSGVHLNNLLLGLAALYLFCSGRRVLEHPVWKGLVIGLGLWVSNVILVFVIPAVAVAAVRQVWDRTRPRAADLAALGLLVAAAAVGCSPRLYYLTHPTSWHVSYLGGGFGLADWASIRGRLVALFSDTLPEYFHGGLAGSPLSQLSVVVIALACLFATGSAAVAFRRRAWPAPVLVCLMLVFWATLAALVSNRQVYDEGLRYLVTLQPFAAVSIALLLEPVRKSARAGARRTLAVLVLAAWLAALGVVGGFVAEPQEPEARQAAHEEIIRLLDREGVQHGFGDYWAAYDIAFRTRERIKLVSFYVDRIAAYRTELKDAKRKAYVFRVSAPRDTGHYRAALRTNDAAYRRLSEKWGREGTATTQRRIGPYLVVVEAARAR